MFIKITFQQKQVTKKGQICNLTLTRVGLYRLNGWGNQPVDKPRAEELLTRSANDGHDLAMFHLGRMNEHGWTREGRNSQAARMWYRKAHAANPDNLEYQKKLR